MKRAVMKRRPPRSTAAVDGLRPRPESFPPGGVVALHRAYEDEDRYRCPDDLDALGFVLVIGATGARGEMYVRLATHQAELIYELLAAEFNKPPPHRLVPPLPPRQQVQHAHPRRAPVRTDTTTVGRDPKGLLQVVFFSNCSGGTVDTSAFNLTDSNARKLVQQVSEVLRPASPRTAYDPDDEGWVSSPR